ncbi:MAG TPA: AEC family transporter [Solirubrobacteraceae bacterium]|nr:AEC family transporter [Solirubrobacteraceae bacterium]
MLLVALWVVLAATAGIACERRTDWAGGLSKRLLRLMLYVLVPFVSYVSFAHLQLSLAGGVGLVIAYIGLGLAGFGTWRLGRRMGLERSSLGGLIVAVIIVNTGYLGYPMAVALLGEHALSRAVAYDQIVGGPMFFTAGFAVGAAFGGAGRISWGTRVRNFLTKNPPLVGVVAGLVVPAALAPHPLVVASHVVVDALLVIGFFTVGVTLSAERQEDHAALLELPDRRVLLALAMRFGVNPLLLGAVSLAGVGIPSAFLLQALMPSGVNGLVIGHAYGLDQRLIATVIVWSTLLVIAVGTLVYLA